MFYNPFRDIFKNTFGRALSVVKQNLLVYCNGTVESDIYLKDLAKASGDYPMLMTAGPCVTFAAGDTGNYSYPGHGSIASYEGTATVTYDGTNITVSGAGTMYHVVFSDGTFLPCIGKTATVNPGTIYGTDGSTLTLPAGDLAAVWAGTQDTYFYEVVAGYYDDVNGRYPYAHAGATYHAPGWNNPTNYFKFSSPTPAEIVSVDNGVHMFTSIYNGDALVFNQNMLENYGAELVGNSVFCGEYAAGLAPSWYTSGSPTTSEETGLYGCSAQGVTNGDNGNLLEHYLNFESGEDYILTVRAKILSGAGAGVVRLLSAVLGTSMNVLAIDSTDWQIQTYEFTSVGTVSSPVRIHAPAGTVCAFAMVSIRKKSQLCNSNKLYYFGDRGLTLYDSTLSGAEDAAVLSWQGL